MTGSEVYSTDTPEPLVVGLFQRLSVGVAT